LNVSLNLNYCKKSGLYDPNMLGYTRAIKIITMYIFSNKNILMIIIVQIILGRLIYEVKIVSNRIII